MRTDMPRVITERPRIFHTSSYRDVRRAKFNHGRELEDLPSHEGMRRPFRRRGIAKQFSDHLAPLRRFLNKQVGRPWAAV